MDLLNETVGTSESPSYEQTLFFQFQNERGEAWAAIAGRQMFELSGFHGGPCKIDVDDLAYSELSERLGTVMGNASEPMPSPLPMLNLNERIWLFSVLAAAALAFDGVEPFHEMLRACGIFGSARLVMDADEVAEILQIDVKGVYTAAAKKEIPGVKRIGRLLRFSRKVFFGWLNGVEAPRKEKPLAGLRA